MIAIGLALIGMLLLLGARTLRRRARHQDRRTVVLDRLHRSTVRRRLFLVTRRSA